MAGDQKKFQTAMMHAERFNQEGKWAEAMRAYRFAMAEFSNNAAAIIGFGKAALASGQADLARKAFTQVLKINPTNLDALNNIADIHERTGQLDAAAETYLRMGNVYASRNDLDTAIDSWIRATKLVSGHVDAHRKLADVLVQQGKIRLAAREFLTLASIYQRQRDLDRAVEHIKAAQELVPGDPGVVAAMEALEADSTIQPNKISDTPPPLAEDMGSDFDDNYDDGDDLFGLDDLFGPEDEEESAPSAVGLVETARQNALEGLANVIFEDSDNPGTMHIMQGLDLQSRDDFTSAISNYQQAVELGSNQASLFFNLGLLYRQQGQLQEAAEMLEKATDDQQYDIVSNFALGETYHEARNLSPAITHFMQALKLLDLPTVSGQRSYEVSQIYDTLAERYIEQDDQDKTNQFVEALQNFFAQPNWEERVYEARQRMNNVSEDGHTMSLAEYLETPETEVIVRTLALTAEHMSRDMLMTASEECLRAIQQAPSFLPLHVRLADILLKRKSTDHAITKYLYIARVFQMRNLNDQAINMYNKVLKLAPMDVTVRARLIDLHTSFGNVPQALEQYLILADSYYQLAQVDRALEKYNEALRLAADLDDADKWRRDALSRMADIYNQRFDWAGATKAYQDLLELNPTDEAILHKLIDLYFKQNRIKEATIALDSIITVYQRQNPMRALDLLKELSSAYTDNLFLRQRLAVAYVQNNMIREAIAEYDVLGEMQMENGQRDQAIQTIQAIINLGPDDVEGYRRLLSQIGG